MTHSRYRDENFEKHIEQIEVAFDRLPWRSSPVVEAVKQLHRRIASGAGPRPRSVAEQAPLSR